MWETYRCCMNCYGKIENKSLYTSRLWPVLCGYAAREDGYILIRKENDLFEQLLVLEELRFITTHETDDLIIVRMEGFHVTIKEELICCIDLDSHAKKIEM